jgi:hypothetical protein
MSKESATTTRMPRLPWPHLLAYLDAALDTPPRTSLVLRQYAGQPLTLKDAEIMRQSISKIRTRIRGRNASLVSPYDALVIRAVPDFTACELQVHYIDQESALPQEPIPVPSPSLSGLTQYQRSCPCFLVLTRPDGFSLTVGSADDPAPSFTEAFRTARPFLPGKLVMTNAYDVEEGRDYEIENGSGPAVSVSSPSGPSLLDDDADTDTASPYSVE